ncbi:MAG: GDP-mannose 4,6-dehydratase, partial [Candidatus Omnitrophica bacterium]|nr:GDP-mannose 4,6-dehydratase [Candidatus Omnitrophota bacterium]
VDSFIAAAENEQMVGEVYNSGSNTEISIKGLADVIQKITKTKLPIKTEKQRIRPAKSEVERLVCDASKIRSVSKWKPKVSLEEGLERTSQWIKKNMHSYKTDIYNV